MHIHYTPNFKKQYAKLKKRFQERFDERLNLFLEDPSSPLLRVHPLKGRFVGYWSMNVSGDLRALYRMDGADMNLTSCAQRVYCKYDYNKYTN